MFCGFPFDYRQGSVYDLTLVLSPVARGRQQRKRENEARAKPRRSPNPKALLAIVRRVSENPMSYFRVFRAGLCGLTLGRFQYRVLQLGQASGSRLTSLSPDSCVRTIFAIQT